MINDKRLRALAREYPGQNVLKLIADNPNLLKENKPASFRKAGEGLSEAADAVLAELRGERDDEMIQNAMDDLFSLREINKDIDERFKAAASRAGMTLDDLKEASNIVNNDIQLVGNISANTPEAITVKYANSRTPRWRGDERGTPV